MKFAMRSHQSYLEIRPTTKHLAGSPTYKNLEILVDGEHKATISCKPSPDKHKPALLVIQPQKGKEITL